MRWGRPLRRPKGVRNHQTPRPNAGPKFPALAVIALGEKEFNMAVEGVAIPSVVVVEEGVGPLLEGTHRYHEQR